jgi:mannose-1-phosphate guanylyltransferase
VVLAGGEGTRLRPLVAKIHGDGRPKQFAVLLGSRSLLGRTLDRTGLAIAPERTLVVAARAHQRFLDAEFSSRTVGRVLVQPADRGTAAGILLPARWIARIDPEATVAFFPSDHYISDDAAFMAEVLGAADLTERHPDRIFLLGAQPDSPETQYGWIERGAELDSRGAHLVSRFLEKPPPEVARACLERGGLWNTFVFVAKVSAVLEAARRALPEIFRAFEAIGPGLDAAAEARSLERAYASVSAANFSGDVLALTPSLLAVSTLPPLTWSDWGTPERVEATLRREGLVPRWLEGRAILPPRSARRAPLAVSA